jgi:cytochrome P450 family 4
MAVMKMCDIIHQRHYKLFYRFDVFFQLTGLKATQEKLLSVIHGLTNKVIKRKNFLYKKSLEEGTVQPSLKDIIAFDLYDSSESKETSKTKKLVGLRDDLDENDENDVGEKRRLAFLDLMIETKHNGELIDDHDIKEEVDTIMFEGHDTTAAGSSFALCLLGIHQDVQELVFKEQQQIFGNSKRSATFADTLEMKYLERVILETLRMYPPVPIIARKINEDVKLKSGDYTLPAGCTVVIGTYRMHHRADLFPNPEVFDPDNFLPEKSASRHYYSYVPFSAGPRSCVGRKYAMLKLKILLSTIVRHYRMTSNLTEKDFKLQGDIILKRADGFRLELEPRD